MTPTVRKFRHPAVQKFELQNPGENFSWYGRKFLPARVIFVQYGCHLMPSTGY